MRCAALLPSISDGHVAGVFEDIGANQTPGSIDESIDLLVSERSNQAKRIHSFDEADFGFEDIPDSGKDMLMKEHVADFFAAACANASSCGSLIEVFVEHV